MKIPDCTFNQVFKHIKNLYGLESLNLFRKLVSQKLRIGRHEVHLHFNHGCIRHKVLPRSLVFKSPINTFAGKKLTRQFGFRFLKLRINESHYWIRMANHDIKETLKCLQSLVNPDDYNLLLDMALKKKEQVFGELMSRSNNKLDKIISASFGQLNNKDSTSCNSTNKNWVINLSSHDLSKEENKVLSLGFNFAVARKKFLPKDEIIASVEKGIKKLSQPEIEVIRGKITNVLKTTKTQQHNLTNDEVHALRNLASNKELVINKADKGNCTVLMDRVDYIEKMMMLLNDTSTYKLIKIDLTTNVERKLNKFIYELYRNDKINQALYYHLRSTDGLAPRIYGLPKIHKPNCPLRPIVSFINSPLYNLSKFLADVLKPLVGSNNFTMKNSFEFVNRIINTTVKPDECLVSFDVISLFSKIPVTTAKDVIHRLLINDEFLTERCMLSLDDLFYALDLCLDNTYLCFRGNYYRQVFGVAMGSPISVIIANLVMENVENLALATYINPPRLWLRYVDDTFVIINKDNVTEFHAFINTIEDSIKFTVEFECNNCIPFLDVLVMKNDNGTLQTKLYRKPTHTNRFLNFNSVHSYSHKFGLVKSLLFRANSTLNSKLEDKMNETKLLIEALTKNDYPDWFLKKALKAFERKRILHYESGSIPNELNNGLVSLPYIPGCTETITRILRQYNIKVVTRPINTIKQFLPNVKDAVDVTLRIGAIYEIPCKDCGCVYIGETGRSFKTRLKEHKRDLKPSNLAKLTENDLRKKTALVKHSYIHEHRIDWTNCKVVKIEKDFTKRRFLESLLINTTDLTMNMKDIENCPKIYNTLL